jgi:type I restriction enzyme S subunit
MLSEVAEANWGNTTITKKSYVPEGYPAYSAAGQDGYLDHYEHNGEGIVLSAIGTVGKCHWATGQWTAIKNTIVINNPNSSLLLKYFYYFSNRTDYWPQRGGSQPFIALKDVREVRFPLPPFAVQNQIVATLNATEELRRLRGQADQRTADLIPALFHEMFGDPATNPKGWPKEFIGEVTYIDAPMVDPRAPEYHDFPHFGADRIEKETGKLLPAKSAAEDRLISGKFLFDDRYVLYSKIRPYLRKVALPEGKGLCSADVYPVRPDDKKMTREFLWSILLSDSFSDFTASLSTRANMPKVNRKQFESYVTILPPLPLQQEFAVRVVGIRAMEASQAASRRRLDDLFQSLLHRAFRGEL